ncbi:hypothetical protein [Flectobacillus roseus]|uniref:hypothetical protein n=1 Tax=Flectobacillus roseus TaxID=502259 RepID=UPI0024B75C47|nr:hypothetical protein [Flectobacillus roseus]MDI9868104.1 hypothetical protein [Flectobacillus roseus]
MQTTVIVPIYKNQLVTLYRQGFNTIDSSRIIFAKLENDIPEIPEGILASKLPVFEEDFEVLLIEFDLSFSTQVIQNKIIVVPNFEQPLWVDFQDIKKIYPISERGAKSLNLGDEIRLEKPIFEKEVRKVEQSFKLKGYFQGGFALLKILGLENSLIKQYEQNLKDTFIEAYNFRNNPKVKAGDIPQTHNNLLKVLCYERYGGIIPENDLGFLCDTGFLFAQTQSDKVKSATDSPFVVKLIQGNETDFKHLEFSQVLNLLDSKYLKVKEGMKNANFQFATYLFYFKIRAILNEGKQVSETSLPQMVQSFKDTDYKNNLITAVWLAGSFVGFSRFFSEVNRVTIFKNKDSYDNVSSMNLTSEGENKVLTSAANTTDNHDNISNVNLTSEGENNVRESASNTLQATQGDVSNENLTSEGESNVTESASNTPQATQGDVSNEKLTSEGGKNIIESASNAPQATQGDVSNESLNSGGENNVRESTSNTTQEVISFDNDNTLEIQKDFAVTSSTRIKRTKSTSVVGKSSSKKDNRKTNPNIESSETEEI